MRAKLTVFLPLEQRSVHTEDAKQERMGRENFRITRKADVAACCKSLSCDSQNVDSQIARIASTKSEPQTTQNDAVDPLPLSAGHFVKKQVLGCLQSREDRGKRKHRARSVQ